MRYLNKINSCILISTIVGMSLMSGCASSSDVTVLRVANWEEYIDMGDWDEDEIIELEDGSTVFGENDLMSEFEDWYYETHHKKIKVEYSCFGTNEELYNQLTLGSAYDLVCPSEYMIMKLLHEDELLPYDESFFDKSKEENYYIRGVSNYIDNIYNELSIDGKVLHDHTAGYMWGTLGIVYNPEYVDEEDASHWNILLNDKYKRQITVKDSVRDAYFAALAIKNYDLITSEEFINAPDYHDRLTEVLNATDQSTVDAAQEILTRIKEKVYSFETDAGKADMVTGKVVANQQWSGDGAYTIEQAMDDDLELRYATPEECTNLWFDGWVMLKRGMQDDPEKKEAAQAFVNFLSRPDNVIRNMYYIGYTSVISGGEDDMIYEYAKYQCEGEEEEVDNDDVYSKADQGMEEGDESPQGDDTDDEAGQTVLDSRYDLSVLQNSGQHSEGDRQGGLRAYPLGYFFGNGSEDDDAYTLYVEPGTGQEALLESRYPLIEIMDRAVVMAYFDEKGNEAINRMWTNVRCFDLKNILLGR